MEESTALALREEGALVTQSHEPFISFEGMSFPQKWDTIEKLCKSNMVPKEYRGNAIDAILAYDLGASVGFHFTQALQSIAVINGRPCIWGDGMIGLVRNSPRCEWIEEVEFGDPGTEGYGWRATAKRIGDPKLIVNTFTIRQAKVAKLWGKEGPWTTYPERMVKMRARSWTCRDGFADVLKGLAMREEVVDVPPEVRDAIVNAPSRTLAIKAAMNARATIDRAIIEDEPPEPLERQAAADVAAVRPPAVEETTAERIEKALDAAALHDPDFTVMPGQEIRDFVNGEAAGRNVPEPELRRIEQEAEGGRLMRANVRDVLRAMRKLALSRMPDAPTDEIPPGSGPPASSGAVSSAPDSIGLRKFTDMAPDELEREVIAHGEHLGLEPREVMRKISVFGENKHVTHATAPKIVEQLETAAREKNSGSAAA